MQGLRVALSDEVNKLNAGVNGGVLWDSEEIFFYNFLAHNLMINNMSIVIPNTKDTAT